MKNVTPTILLVDDSSTNNLLLESALKGLKLNIVTAVSGEAAMHLLKKRDFDLILLDVMMPGMSGYEVLEAMGRDGKIAQIPVILVTARSKAEEEKKARDLGAADYFEKPLQLDKLVQRVKELVHVAV
jgi:CheY-like chemotaxis protein